MILKDTNIFWPYCHRIWCCHVLHETAFLLWCILLHRGQPAEEVRTPPSLARAGLHQQQQEHHHEQTAVLRKRTQQPQPLFSSLFKQPLQQFSLTQDQQEEVQLEEATIQWVLCRRRRLVGGIYTIYYALSLGRKAFLDLDILLLFGTIFAEKKKKRKSCFGRTRDILLEFLRKNDDLLKGKLLLIFLFVLWKKEYVELLLEHWFYICWMTTTSWNKMHIPPVVYYHF